MSTSEKRPPILGLDLGTSTCLACVWVDGKPLFARPDLAYTGDKREMLAYPGELMPSAFCDRDGKPLVGHRALEELRNPRYAGNVVRNVKQRMHEDAERTVTVGGRDYRPSQIVGQYVKVLVRAAELELDLRPGTLREAVVTVPVNFTLKAQVATERACREMGGLQQVQLVDEPVAAAYSLGLHEQPGRQRVLVVDLGGGTFDLALLDVGRAAGPHGFRELCRDGSRWLGGNNWDREIADWALREVRPKFSREDFDRLMTGTTDYGCFDLFRAAENAKQVASLEMRNARMFDPAVPLDHRKVRPLGVAFRPSLRAGEAERSVDVPGEAFFKINERLLKHCELVCRRLFHDAGRLLGVEDFAWRHVDRVYLAGGGSLLPSVQRRFAELAGKPPLLEENPQHAVAKGAALLGELWRRGTELPGLIGRTRYGRALGLLTWPEGKQGEPRFYPVIPGNTELPYDLSKPFPVRGNARRRSLEITFAEEDFDFNGPSHEELVTLSLDDLPPGPGNGGREEAQVSISCGLNMSPTFRIQFRGRTEKGDLNDLVRSNRPEPPPARGPAATAPEPADPFETLPPAAGNGKR